MIELLCLDVAVLQEVDANEVKADYHYWTLAVEVMLEPKYLCKSTKNKRFSAMMIFQKVSVQMCYLLLWILSMLLILVMVMKT